MEREIECDAVVELIRTRVHFTTIELLGCHVGRSSYQRPGTRELHIERRWPSILIRRNATGIWVCTQRARKAKVHDTGPAIFRNDHVVEFEIAMQNSRRVCSRKTTSRIEENHHDVVPAASLRAQPLGERTALH